MTTRAEWQAANRLLLAERQQVVGEPPTAEEMLACSRGELSEEEMERVREKIAAYPELARMYFEPVPDGPRRGDADYMPDEKVARRLRELQERMQAEPVPAHVVPFRSSTAWLPAGIAAALALVFAGLFFQANSRARRFELEARRPLTIGEEQLLAPTGRRGAAETTTLGTDGDAYHLVVIPPETSERYRVEIVNAREAVLWSGDVRARDDGTLAMVVPRALLVPGEYRLVVWTAGKRLATHRLHVGR